MILTISFPIFTYLRLSKFFLVGGKKNNIDSKNETIVRRFENLCKLDSAVSVKLQRKDNVLCGHQGAERKKEKGQGSGEIPEGRTQVATKKYQA